MRAAPGTDTPQKYIDQLPEERKAPVQKLRSVILDNLPPGFKEEINYGMLGYVVPHSVYPKGYHCDPKLPLPFINLASQKNYIAVYHSGLYADEKTMKWFTNEYPKHCSRKLDMGKSCIRFKKIEEIPYDLIGELATKWTPEEWIQLYESKLKSR
ncbi:MAG: DUF1801 domain-containing protein [Flavobacteriales bacterium]|nr:DUF1801 domain-containing protein [Flavobacteriales bacterium]